LELLRAARYHHPITIAYFDLDDFKKVNDHFGHKTGDELLCSVATSMRNILRCTDIFARLGGDEFALLLPETDQQAAECVVRKIRTHLQAIMQLKEFQVTFSLGAICFTVPPASIDKMLAQADALMYTVKTQGKNNFIVTSGN
jgi:diguanylate cyclase (GGDEF)-like protein